ncbi:MAG TPA: hypothetical protein VNM14_11445 [Planctomycetota bacterium]|jgi:hypothetical protein|nr:hypothetical protein [Planctomycetota bacterium]
MKNWWGLVFALALVPLAGCFPEDTWSSRVREEEYQPDPPEHLLRQPADFRLYDAHVRKEFFLYFYEDETVRQEIVTVINYALPEADRRPRLATRDEHDYAIAIFIEDWKTRGLNDKIRYFNERYSQEVKRQNTLLDEKIVYKEKEVQELEDKRLSLHADIKSREMTGTYQGGDDKFKLVETSVAQRELAKTERLLLLARGQLMLLQYLRDQRNSQYARNTVLMVRNSMPVKDLLEVYGAPERLVADVRQKVSPLSWDRSGAWIEMDGDKLTMSQTRDVILQVRDYLDRVRSEVAARKKASQ